MERSAWSVTTKEATKIFPVSYSTLMRYCRQRRIHPRVGKKFGGKWLFHRTVLTREGLLLIDETAK